MFDLIFGKYLVGRGILTSEQLEAVINDEVHARVKLGVIAVAEHIMTKEEADEVNALQALSDRRFGDIAIEKGYLTPAQVDNLLKRQGNGFLHFIQAIIDNGYMSLDELDMFLLDYQETYGFAPSDMDALVSGDLYRVLDVFLPIRDELYKKLTGIAIRTFIRLIDSGCYIEKAYITDSLRLDRFASQTTVGAHNIVAGFGGEGLDLLVLANVFAQEEFETVDMDALDAVAEFTNCIDGLFACELSYNNVEVDMLPPDFYENPIMLEGDGFCVVPIVSAGRRIYFIMAIDSEFNVKSAN